jgi:hypothetical protein
MNGQIRVEDLQELDVEIQMVNHDIVKGPFLPIDFFITSWKNGGTSLTCLEERKEDMVLTNLTHLLCSIDNNTKNWLQNDIAEEVCKRGISTTDYNQRFLNWIEDENSRIDAKGKRYDSLIYLAYAASRKLRIGFHYNKEESIIEITDCDKKTRTIEEKEEDDDEEIIAPNKYLSGAKKVGHNLMQILQARHKKKLNILALRGHTFPSLEKSPCSNFFIGNCKAPTSDSIVKFAIRARTKSLPTKTNLKRAGKVNNDSWTVCNSNQPETLNYLE